MILLKMQVYTQEHGKTNHYKEQTLELFLTCSSVCWPRSVVDIITPAAKEPSSRLKPSLSLHWNETTNIKTFCWRHTCCSGIVNFMYK